MARARAVNATICLDPFHAIKWANEALDAFYRSTPPLPTLDDVAGWKSGQRRRPNWQRLRVAESVKLTELTEVPGTDKTRLNAVVTRTCVAPSARRSQQPRT